MKPYRNRSLLDLAYSFPCFLNLPCCEGGDAGEPAHANWADYGKGGAQKAHDCFYVPACRACHVELDQGKTMDRQLKREVWEIAFRRYTVALWRRAAIMVAEQ